jgi:hypothetical protein
MPPRVAAVAERATTALSPLPLCVVLHIFSLLPVDDRLRCAEVCRGWRSVLLERSLWTRLDLSATSGVRVRARIGALDSLLRCAAARAGGGLQSLHVIKDHVTPEALLAVAAANAGALRELHTHRDKPYSGFTPDQVEALCGAAPLLRTFTTDLCDTTGNVQDVGRALRNEAPFGPLRVRHLSANLHDEDEADVSAFTAEVAAHASLCGLELRYASLGTPAALDAVVEAALARRLQTVDLFECGLSPASVPALTRLLARDALTTLACSCMFLLDVPAARVLAAALRANSTLTSLSLFNTGVFNDPAAAVELLGALTGHASLRVLDLKHNRRPVAAHPEAAGAALGALVAANAPALTQLDVAVCDLGGVGLRALFEALPANTHLRKLECSYNFINNAFAADVVLPAVRANASLRQVELDGLLGDVDDDVAAAVAHELGSRAPL